MMRALLQKYLPELTAVQHDRCECYLALLQKWNRIHNLTAITDPEQQVILHLADSLAIAPFLQGPRLLDVGTGAGLPGIPLAICHPDVEVHLLDSQSKRIQFLTQVKIDLALTNVHLHHARVEAFQDSQKFNSIVSRAFSELGLFVNLSAHLLAPSGRFLAMKGEISDAELAKLAPPFMIEQVVALQVPGLEAARHLVVLSA